MEQQMWKESLSLAVLQCWDSFPPLPYNFMQVSELGSQITKALTGSLFCLNIAIAQILQILQSF